MKNTLVVVTATALALVAADTASAGSRVAYFKVGLVASQDVTWEKHLAYRTDCGSGFTRLEGNGASALRMRTPRPQPAVAKRLRDGQVALRFAHGQALLPVVGSLSRHGVSYATGQTPETTSGCPKPEPPVASDCGIRRFGGHSTIGVNYVTPDNSPDPESRLGLAPLFDGIVLTGPSVPGWQGVLYEWCPGASGDDVLRGPVYRPEGPHSTPGRLPPSRLFGTRRRFEVSARSDETVETVRTGSPMTGSFPIRTKTEWTLTFTRLARRPRGL